MFTTPKYADCTETFIFQWLDEFTRTVISIHWTFGMSGLANTCEF